MPLLTLRNAQLAYGLHPLLDNAQFAIDSNERVGLIGRNGTGKSSLLKVIAGHAALDDGELARQDGLRIVFVEQEPELPAAPSVRDSLYIRGQLDQIALRKIGPPGIADQHVGASRPCGLEPARQQPPRRPWLRRSSDHRARP